MKKLRLHVLIGLILLIIGSVLLIGIIRSRETSVVIPPPSNAQQLTKAAAPQSSSAPTISGQPTSVSIPSLAINLPIIPGYYNAKTQTWTLTDNSVQYATITPPPNNTGGNTFLYGHYRKSVFASLHNIQAGAQAIITTANGHSFYYQLASISVVNPDDSAGVFDYQGKPILTIQTCTGLFFQNRQLFTFNLERVV